MNWRYRYAGLSIASELRLPEWTVFETDERLDDPDVAIRVRDERQDATAPARIDPEEYRFTVRDAGHYQVRLGREIVITPTPGAGDAEIRLFLLGSALAAIAYQRGLLWLHASVVDTAAGAIAFAGTPGAGKSTLAAWLCQGGARLVSDDLARFEHRSGAVFAHPSAPRLKLWRDAIATVGLTEAGLEQDHRRAEKFHVTMASGPLSPVAVRAIYLLGWGPFNLVQLNGLHALQGLVADATYRIDLLEPMRQTAGHWQRCTEVAYAVPVMRLSRPKASSGLTNSLALVASQIVRHLDTLAAEGSGR